MHSTKTLILWINFFFLILLIASSCKSDYGKMEFDMLPQEKQVETQIKIDSVQVSFENIVERINPKTKKLEKKKFYRKEVVYNIANVPPLYPGCPTYPDVQRKYNCSNKKFMQYIASTLNYPEEAFDKNIEGTSVVKFIIDEKGTPIKEEITKSIGYGTDEAVLKVIREMRENNIKWEPGLVNNKAVKVYHSVPVRFTMH